MAIVFSCPHCRSSIKARDEMAGKKVQCPKCKAAIELPTHTGTGNSPKPVVIPSQDVVEATPSSVAPEPTWKPVTGQHDIHESVPRRQTDLHANQTAPPNSPVTVIVNQGEGKTDAPGVIGLIFGVLALVGVLLSCCTSGISGFVALPFGMIGAGCSFFGRGNLRVAGLVLNFLALLPAIAVTVAVLFFGFVGLGGALLTEKASESAAHGATKGVARAIEEQIEKESKPTSTERPVEYWIEALISDDVRLATEARTRLVQMGSVAVPSLRKAATAENAKMRSAAALVLGEIGADAGVAGPELSRLLEDPNPEVRLSAAKALGRMPEPARSYLDLLIRATTDTDPNVRAAASEAVKRNAVANRLEAPVLLPLWKEPDARKRLSYVATIRSLNPPPATTLALFLPLLSDSDPSVRIQAIELLGNIGPSAHSAVFPSLLPLAGSSQPDVRQAALTALPKLGPATSADRRLLEAGFQYETPEARLFCVQQIGQLGNESAALVPNLKKLLRDPSPKVRAGVARSLGQIGAAAESAREDLLQALTDAESEVRRAIIETLGKLARDPASDDALFDALADNVKEVRDAANQVLTSFQPPLGKNDQKALRKALLSRSVDARRLAASVFARLGSQASESQSDLHGAVKDEDFEVRRYVFAALAAYGPEAKMAVPAVLATIKETLDRNQQEGARDLFRQAAETLTKIGDPAVALPLLATGLKIDDREFRKEVIRAIGEIGPKATLMAKTLTAQLSDKELSESAGEALLKIRSDEVVRALCDVVEGNGSTEIRLRAIHVLGAMGPDARNAAQTLTSCWTRNKGKELGNAAREALSKIQR